MSVNRDGRPNPEALLAKLVKTAQARLRVYIGAAPGVGSPLKGDQNRSIPLIRSLAARGSTCAPATSSSRNQDNTLRAVQHRIRNRCRRALRKLFEELGCAAENRPRFCGSGGLCRSEHARQAQRNCCSVP